MVCPVKRNLLMGTVRELDGNAWWRVLRYANCLYLLAKERVAGMGDGHPFYRWLG